jgi:hypothetical protein
MSEMEIKEPPQPEKEEESVQDSLKGLFWAGVMLFLVIGGMLIHGLAIRDGWNYFVAPNLGFNELTLPMAMGLFFMLRLLVSGDKEAKRAAIEKAKKAISGEKEKGFEDQEIIETLIAVIFPLLNYTFVHLIAWFL